MELEKVTTILGGNDMTDCKQSLTERIEAKLKVFNRRMESKLRRRQEMLNNMKAEECFDKSMEYMKVFFREKGGA